MDAKEFMTALRREFPDLEPELEEESWRGLLYMETGCLAVFTRKAIDEGDRVQVARCFAFAERSLAGGDGEVQNALGVSFLEHLNFTDGKVPRRWAFDLLPPRLQAASVALDCHPPRTEAASRLQLVEVSVGVHCNVFVT